MRPHPRPGFAQRRNARADAPTRAEVRARWVALLQLADACGHLVGEEGVALTRPEADDLAHRVTRHGAQPFPLTHASAAYAAEGFRQLARGFIAAAQPELKAALAEAMTAAAACCLRMLELAEAQEAEGFRQQTLRRLGEREEE